jgi:hypothetical protein
MLITKEMLIDALNLLAAVSLKKIEVTNSMITLCWEDLRTLQQEDFNRAIKHFYNCRIFPVAREILEIAIAADFGEDWHKIASVARQSTKEETISGLSYSALLKITNTNGMRSALSAIARADNIQLSAYGRDWQQSIKKIDLTGLPPSNEIISLEVSSSQKDIDYPVDTDYSVRAASLIKLLNKREIKTSTAIAMCSRFPEVKKAEVMAVVEGIEGRVGIEYAPRSTASMLINLTNSFNEDAINQAIKSERELVRGNNQ